MSRGLLSVVVLAVFPGIALAQQPCTSDARHVVDELYRHMLERSADPGSSAWVSKLQSGSTVRDVVHAIVDSPEHMQRFFNPGEGAVANERAVANLNRHIDGAETVRGTRHLWYARERPVQLSRPEPERRDRTQRVGRQP